MSFIFDALKKSESDRQRKSGPALYEVRVAPPRTRLPLWAVAIAVLLAINLGIVMWMLLRQPAHDTAAAAVSPAAPATSVPPPVSAAPQVAAPQPAPQPAVLQPAAPPTVVAPLATPNPGTASATTVTPAAAPPATASGAAAEEQNPQDYAPAQPSAAEGLGNHVRRASAAGVPLYQDAAATPGTQLPQLHLDFHMYAPQPQERFVMINMHKLHEGDSLPGGVHVNSITPEGAVLSYNGQTFLLPRE
jgi:general secretion pathway protein B